MFAPVKDFKLNGKVRKKEMVIQNEALKGSEWS